MAKSNIPEIYQLSEKEKDILISWLKENIVTTEDDSDRTSLSFIRQNFERSSLGFYVHTDVLKQVILECGIEPHNRENHNWLINISRDSPMYK